MQTFEGAVPHAARDLRPVIGRVSGVDRLVQRQRVQDDGVVEGADETVHLLRNTRKPTDARGAIRALVLAYLSIYIYISEMQKNTSTRQVQNCSENVFWQIAVRIAHSMSQIG